MKSVDNEGCNCPALMRQLVSSLGIYDNLHYKEDMLFAGKKIFFLPCFIDGIHCFKKMVTMTSLMHQMVNKARTGFRLISALKPTIHRYSCIAESRYYKNWKLPD